MRHSGFKGSPAFTGCESSLHARVFQLNTINAEEWKATAIVAEHQQKRHGERYMERCKKGTDRKWFASGITYANLTSVLWWVVKHTKVQCVRFAPPVKSAAQNSSIISLQCSPYTHHFYLISRFICTSWSVVPWGFIFVYGGWNGIAHTLPLH